MDEQEMVQVPREALERLCIEAVFHAGRLRACKTCWTDWQDIDDFKHAPTCPVYLAQQALAPQPEPQL